MERKQDHFPFPTEQLVCNNKGAALGNRSDCIYISAQRANNSTNARPRWRANIALSPTVPHGAALRRATDSPFAP
jgi:hypothetical protein